MTILRVGGLGACAAAILASTILSATAGAPAQAEPAAVRRATWFSVGTAMAPRVQWNANDGYCGETSFISAGMLFGQYTSQWTARRLASPGVAQWKASSQLLLGVNDLRAATQMRLAATAFDSARQRTVPEFLQWAAERFVAGDAVIIGVLNNTTILNEPGPGDREYDHIVPVFGIGSDRPLGPATPAHYRAANTITISDNGLHTIGPNYPFLYTSSFAHFPLTRNQANAPGGPVYSLRAWPKNYGTAVSGVLDPDGVTIGVRLTASSDGEGLQNQPIMRRPPAAKPITLTAHVSIPDAATAYRVYLYDQFDQVPQRDFNAKSGNAIASWLIPAGTGSRWQVSIKAMSDQTRVFRAVPVTAP